MNGCIGDGKVSQDDLVTAIAMADRGNVHIQEMTINAEAYEELLSDTPRPPGMNILTFMGPYGAVRITKGDPIKEKKVEFIKYGQCPYGCGGQMFVRVMERQTSPMFGPWIFDCRCEGCDRNDVVSVPHEQMGAMIYQHWIERTARK